MTTRDETVWDRDARAVLGAILTGRETVPMTLDGGTYKAQGPAYIAASCADALAAERAKRVGAGGDVRIVYEEREWDAMRADRDVFRDIAEANAGVISRTNAALGATDDESLLDAARRVVADRDAWKARAERAEHERVEARLALSVAKEALDLVLDEDALDDSARVECSEAPSIHARVSEALASVKRAYAGRVTP